MCRVLELSRSRLGQIDDVPAFLAGAVRHEALNHLRSARRELARLAASGDPGRSATDHHATELNATELMRAIDTLPRRQREIIVLKHSADLTFDQIALALSTNRNTIAARYRVAITALRNLLAPIEPGPPGAIHV